MRAVLRILPAALLLAALALLGWTVFGTSSPKEAPAEGAEIAAREETPEEASRDGNLASPSGDSTATTVEPQRRSTGEVPLTVERLRTFEGEALLQVDGAIPSPVKTGTFWLELLSRGSSETAEVEVLGGRFRLEIPERSRVRLKGGVFSGQRVRFEGLEVAFTPVDSPYVLVGSPFPLNRLVVCDGPTGAHLSGLRVTRAPQMSPVTLRGQSDDEELVLEGASSPIDLPWIPSRTPVWLRVAADGYAPMTAWVDPTQEQTKELLLWPEAALTVRVTGEGREALKALALFHDAGEGRTIAGGVIERRSKGVTSNGAEWVFDLVGLPALPTEVVAKGLDLKARFVDLAAADISLEPGSQRTLVLRLSR
jgi:hypothetical protein